MTTHLRSVASPNDPWQRLYHVVAIYDRTALKVRLTTVPVTHQEACVMLPKFNWYRRRRVQLEEV